MAREPPPVDQRQGGGAEWLIDGIALGSPIEAVLARELYSSPCDDDEIDRGAAMLHFWASGPCRSAPAFPRNTTLIIVSTPPRNTPGSQRVELIVWAGGDFFNQKTSLPFRIGDSIEVARKAFGSPTHDASVDSIAGPGEDNPMPNIRRLSWDSRRVHALTRDGTIVALGVGELRGGKERERVLADAYGHHLRYAGDEPRTLRAAPADRATSAPASSGDTPPLPPAFRRLGQNCDPAHAGGKTPGAGATLCSDKSRVVGVYAQADAIPNPPATATVLSAPTNVQYSDVSFVAQVGDRIWIRRVTCSKCRRIRGWSFVGDVPSMSELQLRDLQRHLGLDERLPALRTVDAWRRQPMPPHVPSP